MICAFKLRHCDIKRIKYITSCSKLHNQILRSAIYLTDAILTYVVVRAMQPFNYQYLIESKMKKDEPWHILKISIIPQYLLD
jgi:hypothetical protein